MIASDKTLREMLKTGDLKITPEDAIRINPSSINLTLGTTFTKVKRPSSGVVDLSLPQEHEVIHVEKGGTFVIAPHEFILATTAEKVRIPDTASSTVLGRSSIGRSGLTVENASWIDPGFEGNITLELFNALDYPIILHVGMEICQLVIYMNDTSVENPYDGKYNGQDIATASRIHLDETFKK